MVCKVQANAQQGYSASDNNYGYDQNQQYSDQNYYSYYQERSPQGEQNVYQQQYEQPTNNYQHTSPVTEPYSSQPASSYSQPYSGYTSNAAPITQQHANNPYTYAAPIQPFVQDKVHTSPVVNSVPYGSYGQQTRQISWLAAFGTGGFEGEAPLLEGKLLLNDLCSLFLELGINFGHIKNKVN